MNKISCKTVNELLYEYAHGELENDDHCIVETHVSICDRCKDDLLLWQTLPKAINKAPLPELAPMVERRFLSGEEPFIHAQKKIWGVPTPVFKRTVQVLAIAAAVALLLFIHGLFLQETEPLQTAKVAAMQSPEAQQKLTATDIATSSDARGRQIYEVFHDTRLVGLEGAEVSIVVHNEKQTRFHVTKGFVVAKVGSVPAGYQFIVETLSGVVEARGTVFSVDVKQDAPDTIRVEEGIVEVRGYDYKPNAFPLLAAGQEINTDSETVNAADMQSMVSDLEVIGSSFKPVSAEKPKENSVSNEETEADAKEAFKLYQDVQSSRKELEQFRNTPQEQAKMLKLARAYRTAFMFAAAQSTYNKIIAGNPSSNEGQTSMVSLGQMELLIMNNPSEACEHFQRYLAISPKGSLSAVAKSGKTAALRRLAKAPLALTEQDAAQIKQQQDAPTLLQKAQDFVSAEEQCQAISLFKQVKFLWPGSKQAQIAKTKLDDFASNE